MFKKKFFIAYTLYIICLSLSILYVKSVLNDDTMSVETKAKPLKEALEVKPVKVVLQVELPNEHKEYKYTLKNLDSVLDLLDMAWDTDKLYYEKTYYSSELVIDNIDRVAALKSQRWRLFLEKEDITHQADKLKLRDKRTYILRLVPTE